jgi:hypothetical protein
MSKAPCRDCGQILEAGENGGGMGLCIDCWARPTELDLEHQPKVSQGALSRAHELEKEMGWSLRKSLRMALRERHPTTKQLPSDGAQMRLI